MSKATVFLFFAGVTFLVSLSNVANAQKWADLSMTVLFDGEVRIPKVMVQNGQQIVSESLLVDPLNQAIENVVFMIDSKKTKLDPKLWHPDLRELPKEQPVLYLTQSRFAPHVLAMRAGETLTVKSPGPNLGVESARFSFFKNEEINVLLAAQGTREVPTKVEEPVPVRVESSIYPWMGAYLIVSGHPYVGVSDSTGVVEIQKLPAGIELNFYVWHESQNKSIEQVTLNGKQEFWKRGCVTLTLKEGANDLGTLQLKPERFNELK